MITPDELKAALVKYFENEDIAEAHRYADQLMCQVLIEHGYGEAVEVFEKAGKWYA